MGDIHFSQGDGEISFCGAIEMSGYLDLRVDIIKGGMAKYGMMNPIFKPGPVEPHYSEYLIFEGISVDECTGKQYYLDAHVAYRRACLNAIEYLKKFGFTGEQAYCCSAARRSRGGCRASSTSPTPAPRWRCRPRSSTRTSCRCDRDSMPLYEYECTPGAADGFTAWRAMADRRCPPPAPAAAPRPTGCCPPVRAGAASPPAAAPNPGWYGTTAIPNARPRRTRTAGMPMDRRARG